MCNFVLVYPGKKKNSKQYLAIFKITAQKLLWQLLFVVNRLQR